MEHAVYCLQRRNEMFYLTTHSTHFIYGHTSSDIRLRITRITREETRCYLSECYFWWLAAMEVLYASPRKQNNAYHDCRYTSYEVLCELGKHLTMSTRVERDVFCCCLFVFVCFLLGCLFYVGFFVVVCFVFYLYSGFFCCICCFVFLLGCFFGGYQNRSTLI